VLGVAALLIGNAIYPNFTRNVLDVFNPFASRTIIEMQPFLRPQGEWTIGLAWGNFNNGFFLASACILYSIIYFILRIFIGNRISEFKIGNIRIFPESFTVEKNILLIWSLVILLATLGQRRFAYYMVVNVALLSAFLSWQFIRLNKEVHPSAKHLNIFVSLAAIIFLIFYSGISPAIVAILVAMLIAYIFWQFLQAFGLLQLSKTRLEPQKKSKHKGRSPAGFSSALYYTNIAVVGIVIFILVFFPNIKPATSIASLVQFAPPNSWVRSLDWMKENTPEPFGDSNFYYGLHEPPMPGEQYDYPDSAYAVMAWVDYGYWINRIAHRPVNLTPGPGGFYVATYFLSQGKDSPGPGGFYVATYFLSQGKDSTQEVEWKTKWGQEIIPESDIIDKLGAKYIMLDNQTVTSKFWALASWAEQEKTQYFDTYFIPQEEDKLVPATLFHPEYYRSLAIRLYNFDGKAVTPEQTIVISYEEKPFQEGGAVKVVNNIEFFPSYEEATSYISSQKSGQFRIVSDSPFVSPVPLEKLEHYELVYSSPESSPQPGVGNVPNVKIFEYVE
jgi:dolichyl-diphosphooligosaccharide--protein glycosyltransferase